MLHKFKIIHIVEEYRHTAGLKENFFSLFPVEGWLTEKLTPRTLDLEVRDSSFARRVVSLDKELLHFVSLHPGVEISTGDMLLGGNPAMD